jgi:hypothetical protein
VSAVIDANARNFVGRKEKDGHYALISDNFIGGDVTFANTGNRSASIKKMQLML